MSDQLKYFFDTEFIEHEGGLDLISIGIVCEDGREFYAEVTDDEIPWDKADPWVLENVRPHLHAQAKWLKRDLAYEILSFTNAGAERPQFWGYYCVAPETKILTDDLRWVPAETLAVGDRLIGFDESATSGSGRSRRWRQWKPTVVTQTEVIERPCYDLEFADGTRVRASADHRWLTNSTGPARWTTTANLRYGASGYASSVAKPLDVWEPDFSRSAGYLAAAVDGDGFLTQTDLSNTTGIARFRMGFSQKANSMLSEVRKLLQESGYSVAGGLSPVSSGVHNLMIGNRSDVIRFLGSVRPIRLLDSFDASLMGAMSLRSVRLIGKVDVGIQPVVAMSTSTGTYIAEGLASHNCDYDWVIFCRLFGRMIDLPKTYPMFAMDLKQWCVELGDPRLPEQTGTEHNALEDARWNKQAYEFLANYAEGIDKTVAS